MRYLYHVTYSGKLHNIENLGLLPGERSSMGGAGLQGHKRGRLFVTAADGVLFWYDRAEQWAHHNSDDIAEDGLVPVVLRFVVDDDDFEDHYELDEIGTRDAGGAEAYMTMVNVEPDALEVYVDGEWHDVHQVDGYQAVDKDGALLPDSENPLFPCDDDLED